MIKHLKYDSTETTTETQIFLVDELNQFGTFGVATSYHKLRYNLDLLGGFDIKRAYEKRLSNSLNGITSIFLIGQFIVVLSVSKDKTDRTMFFLNHEIPISNFSQVIEAFGSKKISKECVRQKLKADKQGNYYSNIILTT